MAPLVHVRQPSRHQSFHLGLVLHAVSHRQCTSLRLGRILLGMASVRSKSNLTLLRSLTCRLFIVERPRFLLHQQQRSTAPGSWHC